MADDLMKVDENDIKRIVTPYCALPWDITKPNQKPTF